MAKIRVTLDYVMENLMPGVRAQIKGVGQFCERGEFLELEIDGPDVPGTPMVVGVVDTNHKDMQHVPVRTVKLHPC